MSSKITPKEINLLFFGVMMGVLGGLIGAIIDRYFSHFGMIYELPIAVLFFGMVFIFMRRFDK